MKTEFGNLEVCYGYADCIGIDRDDETIAYIELDEHGAKPTPEQEAYARLFAAAPQMLEVCKATIESTGGECDIDDCPSCVVYRLAKAAIAAVEGDK